MFTIKRILLAEDDRIDMIALEKKLTSLGKYELISVPSVRMAKEVISEGGIDLLIADYYLEDGESKELIAQFDLPVVFVTGSEKLDTAVEAMKLGAKDYLTKDLERKYLELLPMILDRIERAIQDQEERVAYQERFRDIIENTSDLVFVVASDGRFEYVNPAWTRTMGFDLSELQTSGKRIYDLMHDVQGSDFLKEITDSTIESIQTQLFLRSKSGAIITLEGNISTKMDRREVFSIRGIFADYTRRRQLEREIIQALRTGSTI